MGLTLWAVLGASLLGSVHCAAMCGPLAAAAEGRASYHAGRLALYLLAGALAGALGGALDAAALHAGWPRLAAQVAGGLLVLFGTVSLLRQAGLRLPRVGDRLGLNRDGLLRLGAVPPAWRGLALGAASALLPCGWLYAYLAAAAGSGSAERGVLTMGVFWVGTVPAVLAAAAILQRLTGPLRRRLPAFGALALILIGLLTALGRIGPAHHSGAPLVLHAHTGR